MIRVTYFIVCLLLGITLVSCIRDEALNAEADILTCTVSSYRSGGGVRSVFPQSGYCFAGFGAAGYGWR